LSACIDALERSDLPRDEWELIVVDDASTDETGRLAASSDKSLRTGDTPRGPAFARNAGARLAIGDILVFIDADVAVRPDSLRLLSQHLKTDPALVAVFGAYDDSPHSGSVVSCYRNLLHHYAHRERAGEVSTFWAGCGAVRANAFRVAGGFDEVRYGRPQIEDIELGYRLSHSGRILLDPAIQGKHYKAWQFLPMMRTDFTDRAVPWVRLLLERRGGPDSSSPSLGLRSMFATGAIGAAIAFLMIAFAGVGSRAYLLALAALVTALLVNSDLYRWFHQRGGMRLALLAIPLHFAYLLVSAVAVPVGAVLHFFHDETTSPLQRNA
jgi:Glycosyltransferases, probably involved in cell wall biogenesis